MILESVENGPLIWPTIEENGVTKTKKYAELSAVEKIQADCYMKATNIILQDLPADIYSLQERECKLYDAFDKFTHIKGESRHYLRFTQLINDINIYNMKIEQFQVNTKFLNSLPLEWSFAVPVFSLGDDLITCLNKAMAFLTVVASSSNATSFEGNNASGQAKVVKCYSCQGEGHMARQCTQPKQPRNVAWYKEKAMLAEAQKAGQILDEEQLAFLVDPGVPDGQAVQTIIPNNAAFQTEDLDTHDSDYDDISNAKAVLMANISNYGSDVISKVVQIILWYLDSGCSKHIIRNRSQLMNFVSKFLGIVRFENDNIARIMRYGDYQLGNVTILRVYYVEEKARNPLINPKLKTLIKRYLLHMDLCGPMRVASINGKRYILVIGDDYSRFTWVRFLRSKDEAPKAIIKCIKNIQVGLNATVHNVLTDNGTEFVNQTLREFYENVSISHQTSVAHTPQQNGVVEKRNQTLIEAARTMLIFSKALLFL
ncbi:integrase, catalytic region, zinc finger, CCHC-type containing protein [Tanacetum coccineum]